MHLRPLISPQSIQYTSMNIRDNAAPAVFAPQAPARHAAVLASGREPIDAAEVYDLIAPLRDPEHAELSLGALRVVEPGLCDVDDVGGKVAVRFTPTVPHCSAATLIGLSIRVALERALPRRFKVEVTITEGSHASADAVVKQVNDKERVLSALENNGLRNVVELSLSGVVTA